MAPKKYRQKIRQQKQAQASPKPPKHKKSKSNKSLFTAIGIIAILIIVIGAVAASGLMGNNGGTTNPTSSPSPSNSTIPASDDPYANSTYVFFHTSMGNFTVALRNDMPITTTNFLNLVRQGVYNDTTFHRVMEGFMVQTGIPKNGQTIPNILDEYTTTNHNYNGTIAMANTGAANTGNSQFFINVADNNNRYESFDKSYPQFGKVIYGMDTVMAISHVAVDLNANYKPLQDVTVIGASVIN
jgi:cyclophilin family peptidyl-prolyl cis-trans isomerase